MLNREDLSGLRDLSRTRRVFIPPGQSSTQETLARKSQQLHTQSAPPTCKFRRACRTATSTGASANLQEAANNNLPKAQRSCRPKHSSPVRREGWSLHCSPHPNLDLTGFGNRRITRMLYQVHGYVCLTAIGGTTPWTPDYQRAVQSFRHHQL